MSLRSHARRLYGTYDYGFILGLVVVMFVLLCAAPDTPAVRALAALNGAAILVTVFVTGGVKPRARQLAVFAAVVAVIVGGVSLAGSPNTTKLVTGVMSSLLVLGSAVGIWRGVGLRPVIDRRTIGGVITTYLLIGLFFAYVYSTVGAATDADFFSGGRTETISHFVYFSYVTMTTVGFGDFTADTGLGRTLAITEALTGQLYLVTVVALVVANIGRTRRPRPHEPNA